MRTESKDVYERLVNHHLELDDAAIDEIVSVLDKADASGQYLASGARYLNAVDSDRYKEHIKRMVTLTIDRDREHKYLQELLVSLYGAEYYDHVEELSSDDNFRRIYKRLFPNGAL